MNRIDWPAHVGCYVYFRGALVVLLEVTVVVDTPVAWVRLGDGRHKRAWCSELSLSVEISRRKLVITNQNAAMRRLRGKRN